MSGWDQDNLLEFMKVHPHAFGRDIVHIKDADEEWICKRFTNRLFAKLDWTQVCDTPYVDIETEGKGDIRRMRVKAGFCLTPKQCADIANYIAGRIPSDYIHHFESFAILNYIQYGIYLNYPYMSILRKHVDQLIAKGSR